MQEALEGRSPAGGERTSEAAFARLAWRTRRLAPAGPGDDAAARMHVAFTNFVESRGRHEASTTALGWVGLGPRPRAFARQFAAIALLAGASAGGMAVNGGHPLTWMESGIELLTNAATSLRPGASPGGEGELAPATTVSPTPIIPTPTPQPGAPAQGLATPVPSPTGTPTALATPAQTAEPPATPGTSPAATATPAAASPTTPASAVPTATGTPTPLASTATPQPAATPTTTTTPPSGGSIPTATETPPPAPASTPSPIPTQPAPPAPSATPSPTTTPSPDLTYGAGAGGTVTIRRTGSVLTLISVQPAPGWTYEVEQGGGSEVHVKFTNGSDEVEFSAHLEDGEITTEVESS